MIRIRVVGIVVLLSLVITISYVHFAYAPVVVESDSRLFDESVFQTAVSSLVDKEEVIILAFGDMMLDRAVRRRMNENGLHYPFEPLRAFISDGADIVVANAEGPFTHFESKTVAILENGPLEFTFATNTLPVLKNFGFTLLSQANNHSINFGREGLEESKYLIKQVGMDWFGDPSNIGDSSYSTTTNGIKIAFVGFHEFAGQGFSSTLDTIKRYKNDGAFVIVYPHWGTEYEPLFTTSQQGMAYAFVDAGTDVVLGAHPHVIEPIEIYKNKAIFYSLGNFVFDQSWSRATSEGLAVKITLSKDSVKYTLHPLSMLKSQTSLMGTEDASRVLQTLKETSVPDTMVFSSLDKGVFELKRNSVGE